MSDKPKSITEILQDVKDNGGGVITYIFANGSKQRTSINKEVFYNERSRDRSLWEVLGIFKDTMLDMRAVSFEI